MLFIDDWIAVTVCEYSICGDAKLPKLVVCCLVAVDNEVGRTEKASEDAAKAATTMMGVVLNRTMLMIVVVAANVST